MKPRILVIGDSMIDEHWFGESERLSPEGPIPIVKINKKILSLGAAANVASHIASAGIPNDFTYKATSSPEFIGFGRRCLSLGISTTPLLFSEGIPLTTKTRIWSGKQQICRIDEENTEFPTEIREKIWFDNIKMLIGAGPVNIVILSDYNKGTLSDNLIQKIATYCKRKKIITILDPKRPSFCTIKDLYMVKPNIRELTATNLTPEECSKMLGSTYLIHTLGKDGMSGYKKGSQLFHYPTVAKEVYDVTGAGDSVTALFGIAFYKGLNIIQAVKAANRAASYTVQHIGCYVLNRKEIDECISYAKTENRKL